MLNFCVTNRLFKARTWLAPLVMLLFVTGAQAQAPKRENIEREQKLLEAARKEGTLTVYTSMVDKDIRQLADAFQKKYGVKVSIWRGSAHKVVQRTVTEARAGRDEVDVVQNPSVQMEAMHDEKLLVRLQSPYVRDLIQRTVPAHGEWAPLRGYVFVQAYNTQKVSKDELPRTYADLLDPRWKGRLGIEAKAEAWYHALLEIMGEEKGTKYFRDLIATNGVSVRSGNSVLNNLVVAGEVPFALSVYSYLPERAQAKGAPVATLALKPTIAYTDGIGISKRAPHPNAAALFIDFMLTDGLRLMKEQQQLTLHQRDEADIERYQPTFIDPAKMLINYDRKAQIYQDVISGAGEKK
jgi:iron(III) transport system substrate-binding protein